MPKWIGNRFGSIVPIAPGVAAPSAIYNIFDQYYSKIDGGWTSPSGMTATGGVVSDYVEPGPGNVYRAQVFTSSGTFDVTAPGTFGNTLEYLVVAGGGSGGGYSGANGGGGGGGGGLRTNLSGHPLAAPSYTVPAFPTSYTVTVGAGGGWNPSPGSGSQGSNSEFYPTPVSYPNTAFIRAVGGGYGGYQPHPDSEGGPGGSGGGGAAPSNESPAGNSPSDPNHPQPMGNSGGHGNSNNSRAGGGGGGAGGSGQNASGNFPGGTAGNGGLGVRVSIATAPGNPSPVGATGPGSGAAGTGWFSGGGGGAGADEAFPDTKRGIGGRGPDHTATTSYAGAGNGAPGSGPSVPRASMNGVASTGGGGGGGRESNNPAGSGGSGIVVIRYQIASLTSTAKATGGAISFYNGKTIHTFTTSGTFATTSDWSPATVDYIVVGGGGAGGSGGSGQYGGGGGGAGAVRIGTIPIGSHPVSRTIQVGAGGAGTFDRGNTGTPSYFGTPVTAPGGGGGGGKDPAEVGGPGGSGGGSKYDGSTNPGGTGTGDDYPGSPPDASPTNGWGNDGGDGSNEGGGGGGGAGSAGSSSPGSPGKTGGPGGTGIQIPSTFYNPANSKVGYPGSSGTGWVAGGGGGATYGNPNSGGGGGGGRPAGNPDTGYAGAGHGQKNYSGSDPVQPQEHGNAGANSGSGGGANNNGRISFDGGSGIVIVAYPS